MSKSLKSTVLILGLIGLILISGFITSKTLHPETDDPLTPNLNARSGETDAKTNDNESVPDSRKPVTRFGNPVVTVWVNTKSRIYHCPDTPWYGKTKNGEYMTQQEAQAAGYRPAYGIVCG